MRGGDRAVGVVVQLRRPGGAGSARIIRCGRSAAIANAALAALSRRVLGAVFADRAAVDPAGEAAAGDAAAGFLLDPLGAAVDGAAGVRPVVSLVRRPRRSTIRSGTTRPSRRTATGCWTARSPPSFWPRCCAAAGEAAVQHGSLLGRRHADRGLGVDEELQAEGRLGRVRRTAQAAGATAKPTSMARSARTRPTPRRPIPTRGFTARARARKPSSASSAMR